MNANLDHPVWTVHDVAAFLRMSESEVYRRLKHCEFPAFRVAGDWRFLRSEIVKITLQRTL
jgi:predicted DNA-binding transcriptional regulator AlpA